MAATCHSRRKRRRKLGVRRVLLLGRARCSWSGGGRRLARAAALAALPVPRVLKAWRQASAAASAAVSRRAQGSAALDSALVTAAVPTVASTAVSAAASVAASAALLAAASLFFTNGRSFAPMAHSTVNAYLDHLLRATAPAITTLPNTRGHFRDAAAGHGAGPEDMDE